MTKFIEHRKQSRKINTKIVVLYHGDCSDGFGGAWAAWRKLGTKATYIGLKHDQPPPAGLTGKELYFIDFCYPRDIMEQLMANNKRVTALDHHITTKETVKLTFDYRFDNDHSGAVIAWQYFHKQKPIPKLLQHIEDMDLWRFKIPHTKEVFAYLDLFDFNFTVWAKLAKDFENAAKRKQYIEKGKLLLRYEDRLIERLVENNAELVEFEGYKILAVNSPNFHSQIGHLLVNKDHPISIVWRQKSDGTIVSLRSGGKVNVAELAERHGGGGHHNAAAFMVPAGKPLPWKKI